MFVIEVDTTDGLVRKASAPDLLSAEIAAMAALENPDVRSVRIRAGEGGAILWDRSNSIERALGNSPIARYVRSLPTPEPGTVVVCVVCDLNSADDDEGVDADRFAVAGRILAGEGVGKDVTDVVARAALQATMDRLAEVPALIPEGAGPGTGGGTVGEA